MIGRLITTAWGWFAKLPRGFHLMAGIGLAIVLLFTLHKCAVSDAVKADRKAVEAQVNEKALGAERDANRADVTRQAEIQANDTATRKAIDDAARENPETVPAGPVTRAAVDQLRNR